MSIINKSGRFPAGIQFPTIRTQEPKKCDWNLGKAIRRIAYAAIWDPYKYLLSEVLVDIQKKMVIRIVVLNEAIPRKMSYEGEATARIVKNDVRWKNAMLRRKLNPENVRINAQTVGSSGLSINLPKTRILKAVTYYLAANPNFSHYIPVEGLMLTVDLNKDLVVEFEDEEPTPQSSEFTEDPALFSLKPPLKPLTITQQEGSSIVIKGQGISWYKWKLRYGVDPIRGLQLYHVRYQTDCEDRLILYKISMAEMYVPYGARGKTWRFRGPFDDGEFGIGIFANPLKIGTDLPENGILLDCVVADDTGAAPRVVHGCVGAFERDTGMLYKHTDLISGEVNGRRGRQMVLTLMSSIGNYDYAFDYIFNMDGVIEVKARLTGFTLPRGVKEANNDPTCIEDCIQFTNDHLIAPTHQHFFSYRMDFDVDGVNNHVMQVDVSNDPIGPDNPDGGAFSPKKRIIPVEGYRNYNFRTSRTWQVVNTNSRNRYGTPRGYALKPEEVAYTFLRKGNPYLAQAEFVKHPVWVTAYQDDEQSPAGDFPRSGLPGKGLPKFVNGESVKNVDSVLWYTFGVTHTTRPGDWPIMNVHQTGFSLVPYNFHSQNSELAIRNRCP